MKVANILFVAVGLLIAPSSEAATLREATKTIEGQDVKSDEEEKIVFDDAMTKFRTAGRELLYKKTDAEEGKNMDANSAGERLLNGKNCVTTFSPCRRGGGFGEQCYNLCEAAVSACAEAGIGSNELVCPGEGGDCFGKTRATEACFKVCRTNPYCFI